MSAPLASSLARPWVLIRHGNAPPGALRGGTALAYLIAEAARHFTGVLVIAEWSYDHSGVNYRHLSKHRPIDKSDVLHVFNGPPTPWIVAVARRALPKAAAP